MKERPILFSAPMIRAILDGRKTQTRRVVRFPEYASREGATATDWTSQYEKSGHPAAAYLLPPQFEGQFLICNRNDDIGVHWVRSPFGEPGDRLWVRETWCAGDKCREYRYRADERDEAYAEDLDRETADETDEDGKPYKFRWHPSIFMPRSASRITLEITEICVQRLNELSEDDAVGEGQARHTKPPESVNTVEMFADLWNGLNAARGFGWDTNPWVWAITFRKIEAEA